MNGDWGEECVFGTETGPDSRPGSLSHIETPSIVASGKSEGHYGSFLRQERN